jgi:hypothetical protein
MSDQRPGDTGPLAPRRPLTPPSSTPYGAARQAASTAAPSAAPATQHQPPEPPSTGQTEQTGPTFADKLANQLKEARQAKPVKPAKPTKPAKPVRPPAQPRTTRRARLRLIRLDPWSVMKTSFLLSIAFGIMCVVAVFVLMSILTTAGLWDNVNATIQGLINAEPGNEFDITDYLSMSKVMGITMLIASVDVVFITALATLGAFIYNLSASLLGGIEVTLAEDQH